KALPASHTRTGATTPWLPSASTCPRSPCSKRARRRRPRSPLTHRATIRAVPPSFRPHTTITSGSATLQFYLGDCTQVLPRLAPASIDAIVTSPPYNLGIRYRTYDDSIPRSEYLQWT